MLLKAQEQTMAEICEKTDKERRAILFISSVIVGILFGLVLHYSYVANLFI